MLWRWFIRIWSSWSLFSIINERSLKRIGMSTEVRIASSEALVMFSHELQIRNLKIALFDELILDQKLLLIKSYLENIEDHRKDEQDTCNLQFLIRPKPIISQTAYISMVETDNDWTLFLNST